MRQLSVSIFKEVIERVPDDGKKPLKTLVHQSLLPLIFHVFDENKAVAAVRISDLLVSPWEVAQPPPALTPHRLQSSSHLLAWAPEQQLWGTSVLLPRQHPVPEMGVALLLCPSTNLPADEFPHLLHLLAMGQHRP